MSYSINEAKNDQTLDIDLALQTRDSEALYHWARIVKEQGDDEKAEALRDTARRIDREDMSYDEARDNGEI
jgi:hypothetical protein